ncbi:hypothetical protein [Treponema sp.]|uniref:hypothetical protein n=1 Tax=Treponema sp. TaxID=166 RepID=UPI003FA2EE4F
MPYINERNTAGTNKSSNIRFFNIYTYPRIFKTQYKISGYAKAKVIIENLRHIKAVCAEGFEFIIAKAKLAIERTMQSIV